MQTATVMPRALQRSAPMLLALLLHSGLLIAFLHSLRPMLDQTNLREVVISLVPLQTSSASRQTRSHTPPSPAPETYPASHPPAPQAAPSPSPEAAPATVVPSLVTPDAAPASTLTPTPVPASITTTTASTPATRPAQEIRTETPSANTTPVPAGRGPVTVSGADYLMPPKPTYPISAKRAGEQGKVLLRILIDEKGQPERVDIHLSSGYVRLDEAARFAAQRAVFKPHLEDGRPVPVFVVVPINFSLN